MQHLAELSAPFGGISRKVSGCAVRTESSLRKVNKCLTQELSYGEDQRSLKDRVKEKTVGKGCRVLMCV